MWSYLHMRNSKSINIHELYHTISLVNFPPWEFRKTYFSMAVHGLGYFHEGSHENKKNIQYF